MEVFCLRKNCGIMVIVANAANKREGKENLEQEHKNSYLLKLVGVLFILKKNNQ